MIKDAHELALMRLASEVTLKALRGGVPGAEARHDAERLRRPDRRRARERSGFPAAPACRSASTPALPHGSITPQTIREGTIIMIDGGCAVEGYQSDITRTFVLGKADRQDEEGVRHRVRAQTAALKAARPGVPREAVDAAARKVIEDAGYGPGYKYFTHRVGHGMGMDGHEWPYLVKGNMFGWAKALTLRRA